jgi:uncharacterized protein (TIGR03435 family)
MRLSKSFALFLLLAPAAMPWHQQLAFEVASIKRSPERPGGVSGGCHGIDSVFTPGEKVAPLGRCEITDARLAHLVSIAWGMQSMQMIQSGPEWIQRGVERFDVMAKAEDPTKTTEQQLLAMLQNMLVERFQMKYHTEAVDAQGFALTVDKKGPHLEPSKSQESDMKLGKGQDKPRPGQPVSLHLKRFSMAMLVRLLSQIGGLGPGVDKTGLDGVYDFALSWDDDAGPSLAEALRDQLGLHVEKQKVAISNFIIDSAHLPSAN